MAGGRVATRLARREISAHKGRSLLVALLIMIPVATMTAFAILLDSQGFTGGSYTQADQELGSADVKIQPLVGSDGRCRQTDDPWNLACAGKDEAADGHALPEPLPPVPTGSQRLTGGVGTITLHWEQADFPTTIQAFDFTDPKFSTMAAQDAALPGPGEVVVNRALASKFSVKVGDTITLDGKDYRVTGTLRTASYDEAVYVGPGHPLAPKPTVAYLWGPEFTPQQVAEYNARGLHVTNRSGWTAWADENGDDDSGNALVRGLMLGMLVLLAAMMLLLTGTIAGAAFAIGIRQQRRSLALVAATGASSKTMRRIVTRNGLLLGGAGSLAGFVLGTLLGIGALAWQNQVSESLPLDLAIPWPALVALALVGTLAALVAAWVPARSVARQDALSGVRNAETAPLPAPFPRLGIGLTVLGLVIGAIGAFVPWDEVGRDGARKVETIIGPAAICCLFMFFGLMLSIEWLLQQVGRIHSAPLAVRLALRDGARNRGRAAACVAAALAVTALVSTMLVALGSLGREEVHRYQPTGTDGSGSFSARTRETRPSGMAYERVRPRQNLDAALAGISAVMGPIDSVIVDAPAACGKDGCEPASVLVQCEQNSCEFSGESGPVIADATVFRLLTGREATPEVLRALAEGKIIVFDQNYIKRGTAQVATAVAPDPSGKEPPEVSIPAVHPFDGPYPAMVSAATAAKYKLGTPMPKTVVVDMHRVPTRREATLIEAELKRRAGFNEWDFQYETGPVDPYAGTARWVGLAGLGLLLAVSAVTTSLTLRDALGSHSTLASIGAARRTLRRMAGAQALVSNGLGTLLGVLIGAVPMTLIVAASPDMRLGVHWPLLLALVVGVPVVAALVAMLLVRPAEARPVRID